MFKHFVPLLFLSLFLFSEKLWACIGCGQESYTPKMLLVGFIFTFLPMSLVAGIFWIVRREKSNHD